MSIFKWLFPDPTPDEALITELRSHVEAVQRLSKKAKSRGITVWLHHDGYKGGIFTPYTLTFREAYRTRTDYIKA
jgi:hypothetical protein